ncbi:MAG: tRNA pseudouridine(55) synthase TruB [Prolixibacteraceae bacterium]|nr:tRNA pseudouridine(55) synthase TruB [Prolixibacteraceae bacterium]MBN2650714.1 tRNA pseudouridine(55) synthase TruB [Prolixibacteraceae bacterium]
MTKNLAELDFISGEILLFNKPLDWTSFDVVNRVRYLLCQKLGIKKLKVGHAGTLDPKATGLVVLCTGKATKKIESIQAEEKEYIATVKLGATTPSSDLETAEDQTFDTSHITCELIEQKLFDFKGDIQQVPPVFSAIKVNGKRAFNYARNGEELEMKARPVYISAIEILRFENPELEIKINCGKGTYIRSLARDIGESLNNGAYLLALQRTRIGTQSVSDAWSLADFEKSLSEM